MLENKVSHLYLEGTNLYIILSYASLLILRTIMTFSLETHSCRTICTKKIPFLLGVKYLKDTVMASWVYTEKS